jgi:hypothetical protein
MDFVPGIGQGVSMAAKKIFAGAKAAERLGKLDAMREAEKMLNNGMDERAVWNQTGFFKGDDGLMRFEIDDSGAETYATARNKLFKQEGLDKENRDLFGRRLSVIQKDYANGMVSEQEARQKIFELKDELGSSRDTEAKYNSIINQLQPLDASYKPANSIIHHEELMRAANQPKVSQAIQPGGANGIFFPEHGEVSLALGRSSEETKSTLMHELQHNMQKIEGFSGGANPGEISRELFSDSESALNQARKLNEMLSSAQKTGNDKAYNEILAERTRVLKDYVDDVQIPELAHKKYQRNLGEAEARMVQKRLDYSPKQRRDIFPYDDLDVPRSELWIGNKGIGGKGVLSIY